MSVEQEWKILQNTFQDQGAVSEKLGAAEEEP